MREDIQKAVIEDYWLDRLSSELKRIDPGNDVLAKFNEAMRDDMCRIIAEWKWLSKTIRLPGNGFTVWTRRMGL